MYHDFSLLYIINPSSNDKLTLAIHITVVLSCNSIWQPRERVLYSEAPSFEYGSNQTSSRIRIHFVCLQNKNHKCKTVATLHLHSFFVFSLGDMPEVLGCICKSLKVKEIVQSKIQGKFTVTYYILNAFTTW